MRNRDRLFQIADRQQGYFTSQQAIESGYSTPNFVRFVASGEWIKQRRGIYRLGRYPETTHPDLVLWALWSCNIKGKVQGVWSHETALEIYDLSDVMPAKMHMTVPLSFRRRSDIPKNLVLHFADLSAPETVTQQGYLVTTALKTLIDIVQEGKLSEDLIFQAIQEALKNGLVTRRQLKTASQKSDSKLKRFLDDHKI